MADRFSFLSGSTVILAGSSVRVSLPTNARTFVIRAEGDNIYYTINPSISGSATSTSEGYVPVDSSDMILPIYNLVGLALFGTSSAKAHIQFYAY